jgi:hypothetical protein
MLHRTFWTERRLTRWTGVLFVIYTVLAFSALVAYGGAVLSTGVLPHWVGSPSSTVWLEMIEHMTERQEVLCQPRTT